MLLVDHEKGIEGNAQCEQRYSVEVDCVFPDLNVVAFSVFLLNLLLMLEQLFLANGNYGSVPEVFNRSQV